MEEENRGLRCGVRVGATIMLFAFLLNYPWELIQAPLYEGMAATPHWRGVLICTRATFGDAVIALGAYCAAWAAGRTPRWPADPKGFHLATFVAAGVVITIGLEHLATRSNSAWWGWRYSEVMPVVPVLDVGLVPLLQWLVLPPAVVWLSKRHLQGG